MLFEVLIVLFGRSFSPIVDHFFSLNKPLVKLAKKFRGCFSNIDTENGCKDFQKGAPGYPMFISKNYCNTMHQDSDASTWTLAYVSNPTQICKGGHLNIIDYGIQVPLIDGDIFFFRGRDRHATSLCSLTIDPVYVVGIALNQKLGRAYAHAKRCKLSSLELAKKNCK